MYSLNKSILSFAVANDFVQNMNKVCYKLGQGYQPFCFFANDSQKDYGVLDFTTFNGFLNPDKTLLDEIVDMRTEAYKNTGIFLGNSDDLKKTIFIDYLLSISICYIEVPKYIRKDGLAQRSFDKFLVTKNPAVMAIWMGCQPAEMQAKYTARIANTQVEMGDNLLRVVKLQTSSKGNSISCPRSAFSTKDMTCIPLFMLYAFQKGFEDALKTKILKFTYLKDNGTIRELCSTLNKDILMQYYNDTGFVGGMLTASDIDSQKQGGMQMSSKMNRGYIRIPEVGSSIYDRSGVRALNIARLLKVEEVSEVDTTFIHVDLSSVEQNFYDCIDYALKKFPDQVKNIHIAITGEEPDSEQPPVIVSKLNSFVQSRSVILSTTFHRELHIFMVSHPEWFPLYTGKPASTTISSKSFGVEEMDF